MPAAPESHGWEHTRVRASPGTPSSSSTPGERLSVIGSDTASSTEIGAKLCCSEVQEDTVLLHSPAFTPLAQNPVPNFSHHTPGSPWQGPPCFLAKQVCSTFKNPVPLPTSSPHSVGGGTDPASPELQAR